MSNLQIIFFVKVNFFINNIISSDDNVDEFVITNLSCSDNDDDTFLFKLNDDIIYQVCVLISYQHAAVEIHYNVN